MTTVEQDKIIQASWVKTQEITYINKIFNCSNLDVSNPTIYLYTGNNFYNNRNQLLLRPHPTITSVLKPITNTIISKDDFINYLFDSFIKYTNFRKVRWNLINTSNGSIGADHWGYGYLYNKNILAQETNHILNNKRAQSQFVITTKEEFLAKCSDATKTAINNAIAAITVNNKNSSTSIQYAEIEGQKFYGSLLNINLSDYVRKNPIINLLQAFINACAYITETYWVWFTEQDRSTAHWIKYHLTRERDATKSPIRWTDLSATSPPNDLLYNGSNYDLRHKTILQYWPVSADSNEPDTNKPNNDYTLYMNVPGNFAGWNKEPEKSEAGTYNNGYTTFTLTEGTRIYPYHNLELWPAYKTFMKITYKLANPGTYLNQNRDDFYDEVHLNGLQFDVKLRDSIPIGTTWTTRAYIGANNPNGTRFTPAVTWSLSRKAGQTDISNKGYVLGLKGWTTNPGSTHVQYAPGQVIKDLRNHLTLYPIVEVVERKASPPKMGTITGSWGISTGSRSFANIVGSNVKKTIEAAQGIVVGLYFSDSFNVPKDLGSRTHLKVYFASDGTWHEVINDAQDPKYANKGRCSSSGDGTLCAHAMWNGKKIFDREEIRKGLEKLGLDGNNVYTSASCNYIKWSDGCYYHAEHDIFNDGAWINRISYIKMTESFETFIAVA